MRGKSLLNEKAIIILGLNQSECRKHHFKSDLINDIDHMRI